MVRKYAVSVPFSSLALSLSPHPFLKLTHHEVGGVVRQLAVELRELLEVVRQRLEALEDRPSLEADLVPALHGLAADPLVELHGLPVVPLRALLGRQSLGAVPPDDLQPREGRLQRRCRARRLLLRRRQHFGVEAVEAVEAAPPLLPPLALLVRFLVLVLVLVLVLILVLVFVASLPLLLPPGGCSPLLLLLLLLGASGVGHDLGNGREGALLLQRDGFHVGVLPVAAGEHLGLGRNLVEEQRHAAQAGLDGLSVLGLALVAHGLAFVVQRHQPVQLPRHFLHLSQVGWHQRLQPLYDPANAVCPHRLRCLAVLPHQPRQLLLRAVVVPVDLHRHLYRRLTRFDYVSL